MKHIAQHLHAPTCDNLVRMHRTLFVFAVMVAAGCKTSPTTPAGPLGDLDFVAQLPAGVTPPATLTTRVAKTTVCVGDASHPGAEIEITWQTFEKGPNAYITHASFAVTKPADALTVTLAKHADVGSSNLGVGDPYRALATASVQCARTTLRLGQTGAEFVQFDADGKIPKPKS